MRPLLRPTWRPPLPRGLLFRRELKTSTKTKTPKNETALKAKALEKNRPDSGKDLSTNEFLRTPATLPKIVITPGSVHHNSLPTYIEYAKRVNLEPTKSVFIGTYYEYVVALSLLRLGFSLLRTGRKSDLGIDLIGHWTLSQFSKPFPIIVQCKSRSNGGVCAPRHIRELEGAFRGKPAGWRSMDVLGILATTERATRGVLNALGVSRKPMGFIKVSRTGDIQQFVWNRAAAERGLEGVGVQLRYTPRALLRPIGSDAQGVEGSEWAIGTMKNKRKNRTYNADTGAETDVQLTWMGSPIFPVREDLAQETKELMREDVRESKVKASRRRNQDDPDHEKPRTRGRPKGAKDLAPRLRRDPNLVRLAKDIESQGVRNRPGRPKGVKDKTPRKLPKRALSRPSKTVQRHARPGRPKGTKNKDSGSSREILD